MGRTKFEKAIPAIRNGLDDQEMPILPHVWHGKLFRLLKRIGMVGKWHLHDPKGRISYLILFSSWIHYCTRNRMRTNKIIWWKLSQNSKITTRTWLWYHLIDYMGLTRCRYMVDLDAEVFLVSIPTATISTPMEEVSQSKSKNTGRVVMWLCVEILEGCHFIAHSIVVL